jgi:membrane protein implicated in regulation of membrane protease activity
MSKAIGLILTVTGLMLGWVSVQIMLAPGLAPLPYFVVAAIAVAMLSVGIRYILKSPKQKKQKEGSTS